MSEEHILPSAATSSVIEILFRSEQSVAVVVSTVPPFAGGLYSLKREFRKPDLAASTVNRIRAILGKSVAADRARAEGGIPTAIHRPELFEMETRDCVYNLFRNKQRPEILCAVPEDRPVPNFVVAEHWSVLHPLRPWNIAPPGFQHRAASAGVRFNGFHLFQGHGAGSVHRPMTAPFRSHAESTPHGDDMFLISEQYTASSQEFFESRLAAFSALTNIALKGTEKIVALNMAVAQASLDDATRTARDFLSAKGPQAAFSLATACAKPNAEKVAAYSRDLTEILSATRAQYSEATNAQVADAQSQVSAWVDGISKNAPAGTERAGAILKSVVATAQDGYEQINTAAKQAIEMVATNVANVSDQSTLVTRKAAAK